MSKQHKYHAQPTIYNGLRYDSKAEAIRASELDLLVRAGEIAWWTRQVPFWLGVPCQKMVVDFLVASRHDMTVYEWVDRVAVKWLSYKVWAEEVKGMETPIWRRNKKLWQACGPLLLKVLKRRGQRWDIEAVRPEDSAIWWCLSYSGTWTAYFSVSRRGEVMETTLRIGQA